MDMDEVEQDEWVCKDLERIFVRFKELDTKEKILRAVALWRAGCWRRWQEKAGRSMEDDRKLDETDMSIEARVARHLIKFEKLRWIWLGYQTWTPNPFDLTELQRQLSHFVTLEDAVSCALVSKAWAADFIPAVWFKVDFDSHPSFANLEPHTVAKHGHLIRIVKNAKTPGQVAVLANARFRFQDDTGAIISEFLLSIVTNPTKLTLLYKHMSMKTITRMLLHRSTLEVVGQFRSQDFDFENEAIPPNLDYFHHSGRFIQLIPSVCSQLRVLNLHSHEMDMDIVEMGKWNCEGLQTLRIRVKGLDTKEKILKAIALWRKGCWRRWREQAGTSVGEEGKLDETDMSIEARVARHLLQFEKLWWVWLGYQTWTPM
ncbi:hypothetical protein EC991_009243 [Linnemannia zychae]|nr:hypothetical protein EC991_009243 [Linnemannia zychae]